MHFLEWKCMNFRIRFHKVCSWGSNYEINNIATLVQVMVWSEPSHSGFPQTSLEKFQWFFNDASRQKSQISMMILNVTKRKKHRTTCHAWSPHTSYDHHWVFCFFQKICKVSLLDLMTNTSVNNVYVKYIFIYPCSQSKLCLFQNSMIFPWVTDPKFNDFSMIFPFLQISRTFQKIQWFFHDLETDPNFNDFSRAVGTLPLSEPMMVRSLTHTCIIRSQWVKMQLEWT